MCVLWFSKNINCCVTVLRAYGAQVSVENQKMQAIDPAAVSSRISSAYGGLT